MVSRIYDDFYCGISATPPTCLMLDPVRDKILDKMNQCSEPVLTIAGNQKGKLSKAAMLVV